MYIAPTPESIATLIGREIDGPVTMLNLMRFRAVADYTEHPDLAPDTPISGEKAYDIYAGLTMEHLTDVGGNVLLMGSGGPLLIGPAEERWDRVLVIEYPSLDAFLSMIQNPEYLKGAGHRTASLEDSRLLPIT
ncbi:MAG: DUF1330 domain-containing protein [Actinomycetia bacterium]|nr:DUF1330 domain-containing protein [Actinomycetes bacterium]